MSEITKEEVEKFLEEQRKSGVSWFEEFSERKKLFSKHWYIEAAKTGNNVFGLFEPKSPVTRRNWDAHGVLWLSDGKAIVYQSQPYKIELEDTIFLNQFCEENKLKYEIVCIEEFCWYNPGEVFSIFVWVGDKESLNPIINNRVEKIHSIVECYDIEVKQLIKDPNLFAAFTHKDPMIIGYGDTFAKAVDQAIDLISTLERKEENED